MLNRCSEKQNNNDKDTQEACILALTHACKPFKGILYCCLVLPFSASKIKGYFGRLLGWFGLLFESEKVVLIPLWN